MGALASRPLSIYPIKGSGLWPNWGLQNFQQGRLGVAVRLEVGARLAIFNSHFPSYIVGLSGGGKSWGAGGSYLTPPHPPKEKQPELKCISVVCFMSQGGWTLGSPDPHVSHLRTLPFLRPGAFTGKVEALQPQSLAGHQNSWRD